jgi:hypothetical protein
MAVSSIKQTTATTVVIPSYTLSKITPSQNTPGIIIRRVRNLLSFKLYFHTTEAVSSYWPIVTIGDGIGFVTGAIFEVVNANYDYVGSAYADANGNTINVFTPLSANTNYVVSGLLLLL